MLAGLLMAEGYRFERQFGFAEPDRKWRADFRIGDRLLVEVEGVTYFPNPKTGENHLGGHQTRKGVEKDCEKYNAMAILGWDLLRFTQFMIYDGRALDTINRYFAERAKTEQ